MIMVMTNVKYFKEKLKKHNRITNVIYGRDANRNDIYQCKIFLGKT
jgi:hypothetical protein